jgi:asparagine synthase (glutamine-hydrolysing)
MSALAGFVHFDGQPIAPNLLQQMTRAMAHRGPDGSAHWHGKTAAMGHCMLRTTVESQHERQPLANDDSTLVLVLDGRVDNRDDLVRDLRAAGMQLRTGTDAELVLRAYEAWGDRCASHLVGEYAFFIWDHRAQRLFAARDAAGVRHFYYHAGAGWFAYASEIKGLLALDRLRPRLNESRLLDFMVDAYERDDQVGTLYQGIVRLPAGHAMSVTAAGARTWRYWDPGELAPRTFVGIGDCIDGFMDQLRQSVQCRLRTVKPMAAMLSGGLDSSTIVALISREFHGDLAEPLRTFSLVQEHRDQCPDSPYIDSMLADNPHLHATRIPSSVSEAWADTIDAAIRAADEPFTVVGGLSYDLVYQAAAHAGCVTVFDGMAGDQMFYSHRMTLSTLLDQHRFDELPALLAACQRHGWMRDVFKTLTRAGLRGLAPAAARAFWRRSRDGRVVTGGDLALLHRPVANALVSDRRPPTQTGSGVALNDQALHAQRFLNGLLSFAHERNGIVAGQRGVEPTCPFSDRRMIEFAVAMPIEAKWTAHWYKNALRRGTAGLLPEPVRWRRTVGGHPGPAFYDRVARRIEAQGGRAWSASHCADVLERWVDRDAIAALWTRAGAAGGYPSRCKALELIVASRWLVSHGLA